jgi:hypothetical protein
MLCADLFLRRRSTPHSGVPEMSRIVFVAAMIASVLALGKREHALDRTGLFGACTALSAPAPQGGRWLECRPGKLSGYPDLSQDSCSRRGLRGESRYWVCPTALVAAHSPDEKPTR